jgi:hypothetical protein
MFAIIAGTVAAAVIAVLRCDRRMVVRESVDLDAPEIHSGNPRDTRLASKT